jgi:hypothetical protein
MGICKDAAVTYLQDLGYNVVRHPREGIAPLQLVGVQNGETTYLGGIDKLLANVTGELPRVNENEVTAGIRGQQSSKIDAAIGVKILQSALSALGGSLGISAGFKHTRTIQFVFDHVLSDSIEPLALGRYLRRGVVDAENPVLNQYVLGNGRLFVITRTVKTNKFTVAAAAGKDTTASLDVPAIQQLASGKVKVTAASADASTVSFEGSAFVVFGFQCHEIGVADGALSLVQIKSGSIAMAAGDEESGDGDEVGPTMIADHRLLDIA